MTTEHDLNLVNPSTSGISTLSYLHRMAFSMAPRRTSFIPWWS
jgi:hypothetical protein